MRVLIIDAKENLGFNVVPGLEILTMNGMNEDDLGTIAELSPDIVFLAFRFPGYAVDGQCLQGPQILPLLWKYISGVPIVGIGNWPSIDKGIDRNLSGVETRERFKELYKEFLI